MVSLCLPWCAVGESRSCFDLRRILIVPSPFFNLHLRRQGFESPTTLGSPHWNFTILKGLCPTFAFPTRLSPGPMGPFPTPLPPYESSGDSWSRQIHHGSLHCRLDGGDHFLRQSFIARRSVVHVRRVELKLAHLGLHEGVEVVHGNVVLLHHAQGGFVVFDGIGVRAVNLHGAVGHWSGRGEDELRACCLQLGDDLAQVFFIDVDRRLRWIGG